MWSGNEAILRLWSGNEAILRVWSGNEAILRVWSGNEASYLAVMCRCALYRLNEITHSSEYDTSYSNVSQVRK